MIACPLTTATESAAIAVLYAAVLSIFVYREMSGAHLHGALLDTGKLAAVALFCVGTASAFGWLLAYYQIPKALLAGVGGWGMGVTATGFFIAFVFLVVGCFLDAIPAIIIVGTDGRVTLTDFGGKSARQIVDLARMNGA